MAEAGPDATSGVRLAEIVAAIALAADLGLGQPLDHVLRSCTLATRFAEHLGTSEQERTTAYWVALFMSAGCPGVSFELARIFGDDIALRADLYSATSPFALLQIMLSRAGTGRSTLGKTRVRAQLLLTNARAVEETLLAHCQVSIQLATRVGLGESVTAALGQSFARWDGGPSARPPGHRHRAARADRSSTRPRSSIGNAAWTGRSRACGSSAVSSSTRRWSTSGARWRTSSSLRPRRSRPGRTSWPDRPIASSRRASSTRRSSSSRTART